MKLSARPIANCDPPPTTTIRAFAIRRPFLAAGPAESTGPISHLECTAVAATDRVTLGRSGVEVTCLGVGTGPLGGLFEPVSDEAAAATLERAWALGLRYYDTAPLYGRGEAERRLGGFLAG